MYSSSCEFSRSSWPSMVAPALFALLTPTCGTPTRSFCDTERPWVTISSTVVLKNACETALDRSTTTIPSIQLNMAKFDMMLNTYGINFNGSSCDSNHLDEIHHLDAPRLCDQWD